MGKMNTSAILTAALSLLLTQGQPALVKAFTPPESWVRGICKRTGANPDEALQERNEEAELWAAFVEDLANVPSIGLEVHGQAFAATNPSGSNLSVMPASVLELAVLLYRFFGRAYLMRALTPPRSVLESICKRTGAVLEEVIESRDKATLALVEFIESLVDRDFEPQPTEEE